MGKGVNITLKRFGGTGVFGNKTMIVSTMLVSSNSCLFLFLYFIEKNKIWETKYCIYPKYSDTLLTFLVQNFDQVQYLLNGLELLGEWQSKYAFYKISVCPTT